MSVGKRVSKACKALTESDWEQSLHDICSAIDPTCKGEYGQSGKASYKRFVSENLPLITRIAFGGSSVGSLHVQCSHLGIPTEANGLCGVEDIIYHAVRCGLYHEAKLPDSLIFHSELTVKVETDKLYLPMALIYGVVLAVVLSPVNANERMGTDFTVGICNVKLLVDSLWGNRERFKRLVF